MNVRLKPGVLVFAGLLLLAVVGRLLPHPPNFTPVAAVALFAGFFFKSRWHAILVPALALAVSDGIIGTYDIRIMAVVYAAMLLPALGGRVLHGRTLRGPSGVAAVGLSSLAMSIVFFLSTNLACVVGGFYEPTAAGVVMSLTAGLPFFKYTLAGDAVFSFALFAAHMLITAPKPWATSREPFLATA